MTLAAPSATNAQAATDGLLYAPANYLQFAWTTFNVTLDHLGRKDYKTCGTIGQSNYGSFTVLP